MKYFVFFVLFFFETGFAVTTSTYFYVQKDSVRVSNFFKIIQKAPTIKKGIYLRLKRVFDDSRCPEDAQCIWAGEVSVAIIVYKNKKIIKQKSMTLNSKKNDENKEWFSNLYNKKINQIALLPILQKGNVVKPKDYFIKLYY